MKKIFKFLSFLIVSLFSFFITYQVAHATTNLETYFQFTVPQENVDDTFNSDYTFKEFTDMLVSQESEYYYYQIQYYFGNMNYLSFNLIPKNVELYKYNFYGYLVRADTNTQVQFYFNGQNTAVRIYNFTGSSSTSFTNEQIQEFKNCYLNNVCSSTNFTQSNLQYINSTSISYFQMFNTTYRIDFYDSQSVNFDDYELTYQKYIYRTNFPMTYDNTYIYSTNYRYPHKSIIVNDITLQNGDNFPTYYDLYVHDDDTPSFIGYSTSLNTFYTNLVPTSLTNYSLKVNFRVPQSVLGFSQEPQEYVDNVKFEYLCSGRVNNTNYYSYDSFNCSLDSSYSLTESNVEYTFNNFSSNHGTSGYDKIYITIKTKYIDNNINKIVHDLKYTYSLGGFYNTDYKGSIYEDFTNLPLNFKLLLSSNNILNDSKLYFINANFLNSNLYFTGYNISSQSVSLKPVVNILGSYDSDTDTTNITRFMETNVSNSINQGLLIYQKDSLTPIPKLELFFNKGMIISFNNNIDSNTFYYVDSQGNITSSDFIQPISEQINKYDISYYVSIVNSFINDLSYSSIEFSNLTQTFYDSLPLFFQTFIFVVFIVFCIYFIFELIKRK